MHLWHHLSPGKNPPQWLTAVIEICKGSRAKYEVHKQTGLLVLDRVLHSSVHYPVNYGIIPRTLAEDDDPLDILVLCLEGIQPGTLAYVEVIGVMNMIDQGVPDDKIIGVVTTDPSVNTLRFPDLPAHFKAELAHFFETYTDLENKTVTVPGFQGPEAAFAIIEASLTRYSKSFPQ
jgi:inorganic pyrophosphatase